MEGVTGKVVVVVTEGAVEVVVGLAVPRWTSTVTIEGLCGFPTPVIRSEG